MKVEKNMLEKSIVELIIEADLKTVANYRKDALVHLEKHSEIKGFRKWAKIPENILVRQYGEDYINRMVIDFAIDGLYKDALRKEKVIPVAQAEIKEIISESPLKFKVHIEVFPTVEVDKKYKDIKIEKKKLSVTKKEVDAAIAEIEKKFTKFEEASDSKTKAKMGDRVTISTEGFEWDKLLENTSMVEYPIVLGSNVLVPGFEEQIVWAKAWDKLEFPVEFPKDYHNKDFAWKNTTFKVEVIKVEVAVKPEFTPEFIEQLRGKKLDFDGFKELIKSEILDTKESNARMEEEDKLINELLKITKLDIWDGLLKNQIEKVYSEIKQNIANDGLKITDYLESLKMDEETYKEKHVKQTALKRLQWELIMHKLNEIEKIEVSDDELQEEITKTLSQFQSEDVLKRLKELYVPGNKYYEELRQRMAYRKLIDSFFVEKKTATKAKK